MSGGWILQQRLTDEEIIAAEGPVHLSHKQDKPSAWDQAEKICWTIQFIIISLKVMNCQQV